MKKNHVHLLNTTTKKCVIWRGKYSNLQKKNNFCFQKPGLYRDIYARFGNLNVESVCFKYFFLFFCYREEKVFCFTNVLQTINVCLYEYVKQWLKRLKFFCLTLAFGIHKRNIKCVEKKILFLLEKVFESQKKNGR